MAREWRRMNGAHQVTVGSIADFGLEYEALIPESEVEMMCGSGSVLHYFRKEQIAVTSIKKSPRS